MALQDLIANNRIWAEGIRAKDPGFFDRLVRQQSPRYLWIALFLGFYLSGRRKSPRPARIAVTFSVVYVALMMATTFAGRSRVERAVGRADLTRRELMVAPVPLDPLSRQVILVEPNRYRTGKWSVVNGLTWGDSIPINRDDPAVDVATRDPELQPFLHWTRFPFFIVSHTAGGGAVVLVADARYTGRDGFGWATRTVELPTPR